MNFWIKVESIILSSQQYSRNKQIWYMKRIVAHEIIYHGDIEN